MRTCISLGDISSITCDLISSAHPSALGILFSPHTIQGATRLAIFYSSASVFNSQWSAAKQQICLLQAENTALRDAAQALTTRNNTLAMENEALRGDKEALHTHNQGLSANNALLKEEKNKLVDELRAERLQSAICIRAACEERNRIVNLEQAAKQRDAFIYAMIDIELHQPVLKNAYGNVEKGHAADESLIQAIRSAADQPGFPWSRLLAPPDIMDSGLYKYAIELAATARLRTDENVRVARFWKHLAKLDTRNVNVVTPSPSTLNIIDTELQKRERDAVLDDLLEALRAGEDIRSKKARERNPIIIRPDTPESIPNSPTIVFFDFYRKNAHKNSCPRAHLSSSSSFNSDPCIRDTSLATTSHIVHKPGDFPAASCLLSCPSPSLERIHNAFTTWDAEGGLNDEQQPTSLDFAPVSSTVSSPLQPMASVGRGRSATVPFSARDLALLPVKQVMSSKVATIAIPGDQEKKAQATKGQRVRFDGGTSLIRSKAIIGKPRSPKCDITTPPMKCTPKAPAPTEPLSHIARPTPGQVNFDLPAPSDGEFIKPSERYIRPTTVTRKRGSGPAFFGESTTTPLPLLYGHAEPPPLPPSKQKIRPYVVGGPSLPPGYNLDSTPSDTSGTTPQPLSPGSVAALQERPGQKTKQTVKLPPKPRHTSRSNKENVPPQARPVSTSHRSSRSSTNSSRVPLSQVSSSPNHSNRNSTNTNRWSPPAVKQIIPILKPVRPLHIVKKNPIKKSIPLAAMPQATRFTVPPSQLVRRRSSGSATSASSLEKRGDNGRYPMSF